MFWKPRGTQKSLDQRQEFHPRTASLPERTAFLLHGNRRASLMWTKAGRETVTYRKLQLLSPISKEADRTKESKKKKP